MFFSSVFFFSLYTFGTSLRFIVVQYKMYRAYSREKPFLTRKFCFIFLFYLLLLNYLDARLVWLPVYVQNIFATKASSTSIYSWRMTHRKANNIKNHATPPFQHIRPSFARKTIFCFSFLCTCYTCIYRSLTLSLSFCHTLPILDYFVISTVRFSHRAFIRNKFVNDVQMFSSPNIY